MKKSYSLLSLVVMLTSFQSLFAQNNVNSENDIQKDYLERHAIYDYSEDQLSNTDTIPDYTSQQDKLMITGTIYQSDGKTPAKDVVLYISQPDENGDYELKTENDKRYVHHRGWVKTGADGRYTFYTFVPGNFIHNRELKHIHPTIKEPGKVAYDLDVFLFDSDPFLSKSCRKRLARKGIDSILVLEKKEGVFVATKDIVLEENEMAYNK